MQVRRQQLSYVQQHGREDSAFAMQKQFAMERQLLIDIKHAYKDAKRHPQPNDDSSLDESDDDETDSSLDEYSVPNSSEFDTDTSDLEDESYNPHSDLEAQWLSALKQLLMQRGGRAEVSQLGGVKPPGLSSGQKLFSFLLDHPETFDDNGNHITFSSHSDPEAKWLSALEDLLRQQGGCSTVSQLGGVKPSGISSGQKLTSFLLGNLETFAVDGNQVTFRHMASSRPTSTPPVPKHDPYSFNLSNS